MDSDTDQTSRPGKIVFGDDGSPPADLAWTWINNHPWSGWKLEVVTATEPPLAPPAAEGEPELVEWDSPYQREANPEAGLASVRFLTAVADPRILLSRFTDAELLVVGSKGLNPLQALLVGSTTEWLLADPPSPLLVPRSSHPVKTVVVAVDGSTHAHRAVEALTRMPWSAATMVTMVVVDDGRIDQQSVDETGEVLRAAGIEPELQRSTGRPTSVILAHLSHISPELAVIGTRGLSGLDRLRLGSTAAAIIRHGNCSVLAASD